MLLDTGVLPDPCMRQLKSAISVPASAQPSPNEVVRLQILSNSYKNCHKLLYSVYDNMTSSPCQISHKLLLQALASLKHGMKSGTAEHKATGESGGMVQALVDVANFCDRALRAKEDEGTPHLETLARAYTPN